MPSAFCSSAPGAGGRVIEPGARAAVAATDPGRSVSSGRRARLRAAPTSARSRRLRADARVHSQPCPLFVPLVEEGWFENPATELIAREYLESLQRAKVDVLVLGCTHYPLLKRSSRASWARM